MRAYRAGFYTSVKAAALGCDAKPSRVRGRLNGQQSKMERPGAGKLLTTLEEEAEGRTRYCCCLQASNKALGIKTPRFKKNG